MASQRNPVPLCIVLGEGEYVDVILLRNFVPTAAQPRSKFLHAVPNFITLGIFSKPGMRNLTTGFHAAAADFVTRHSMPSDFVTRHSMPLQRTSLFCCAVAAAKFHYFFNIEHDDGLSSIVSCMDRRDDGRDSMVPQSPGFPNAAVLLPLQRC
jgi:hypothetical protein